MGQIQKALHFRFHLPSLCFPLRCSCRRQVTSGPVCRRQLVPACVPCDRRQKSCPCPAETITSPPRRPTAPPLPMGNFASVFVLHKSFPEQTSDSNPTPLNTTAIFPQQPPLAASFMSILANLHYGRKGCLRKVTKSWGMEEAGRNTF